MPTIAFRAKKKIGTETLSLEGLGKGIEASVGVLGAEGEGEGVRSDAEEGTLECRAWMRSWGQAKLADDVAALTNGYSSAKIAMLIKGGPNDVNSVTGRPKPNMYAACWEM